MYQKNFVQGKWAILSPKMAHPHDSGSVLRIFLKFCRMKEAIRYMKILLVFFWEKNSIGTIWSFKSLDHFLLFDWAWSSWARPLLIGSLNSQDMTRILIQWRYDKVNIYVVDIVWILCDVYAWRSKFMVLLSFFMNL